MRLRILLFIYTFLFVFLVSGLFRLQVVKGPHFSHLGERNRIRTLPGSAARGSILDRNGHVLAETRPAFNVLAVPDEMTDESIARLSHILSRSPEEIQEALKKSNASFVPTQVIRDAPKEKIIQIEEQRSNLTGVTVQVEPMRYYPQGTIGAHVIGYVGRAKKTVSSSDLLGVMGVEQSAEEALRGQPGGQQIEVNNRGKRQRLLGFKLPRAGDTVSLTLDLELQRLSHQLLDGRPGALVALDPRDGQVLALASSPSFDPGAFVEPVREAERIEILQDSGNPLFNRAVMGQYPPGSTFKMIVAAIGLYEGVLSASTHYFCSGAVTLGKTDFHCWERQGHGDVDLLRALSLSCNSYFYRLGLVLGPDRIEHGARLFGLSRSTGVPLSGESTGFVPGRRWKRKARNESWYDGETAHFSIGQGYLSVTPIQVAQFVSVFANGGFLTRPYLIQGKASKPYAIGISPEHLAMVRQGLSQAVNEPWGTGGRARVEGLRVAGKTGTAEVAGGKAHAWFCGFAPSQDARIAVAVFVEHGGQGSQTAASIAGRIFSWWNVHRSQPVLARKKGGDPRSAIPDPHT